MFLIKKIQKIDVCFSNMIKKIYPSQSNANIQLNGQTEILLLKQGQHNISVTSTIINITGNTGPWNQVKKETAGMKMEHMTKLSCLQMILFDLTIGNLKERLRGLIEEVKYTYRNHQPFNI